ncbi:MAG TPA: hypothetical protein VED46_17225 [Alphaproteobacteria bacterium]|nr:hypothetical protein [Alphaproteobacteria bacterium]
MHVIVWTIASLPLIGLAVLLVEIMTRDPHALLEMAQDYERFAKADRAPAESVEQVPIGAALHA